MSDNYMKLMQATSHLSGPSASYIESLYEAFLADAESIPTAWREFFTELPTIGGAPQDISHAQIKKQFLEMAKQPRQAVAASPLQIVHDKKQAHVLQLINAYRAHGHHQANLDPLNLCARKHIPDLELGFHQLSDADLDTQFSTESPLSQNGAKLSDIVIALKNTYCKSFACEYMHITDSEQLQWLQQRLESNHGAPQFPAATKKAILDKLVNAEGLEKYLGSRFVGQKRFSLEGAESLIPMMNHIIHHAGSKGLKEAIIGMAHRGRLNVLVNVLGKNPTDLFQEFEGKVNNSMSGDVKYHLGFSSDVNTTGGIVHLALAFNPSHLEIISPVVEGSVRVRQRRRNDLQERKQVIPIIIHGDAAFAGQGVVMETFNFSQARGYSTGGTIHIVINNQIGFTTSNPIDSRSTLYCTDVAKMVQAPIFHVNADDPEAVLFAAEVAYDFKQRFKKDVVIDLVCYRRHGHNEADEPSVTQPKMYKAIKELDSTLTLYSNKLVSEGVVTTDEVEALVLAYRDKLDNGEAVVKTVEYADTDRQSVDWEQYQNVAWDVKVDTTTNKQALIEYAKRIDTLPEDFALHPVIKRLWQERKK